LNYAFLLGRGRTGTTWIGQILNQYDHCIYKYEPFNLDKPLAFRTWLSDLDNGDRQALADRFRDLCLACWHDVDYPPFLRKSCRRQWPWLLRATWGVGKVFPWARGLYHWYGRPRMQPRDWVLLKQVNFPNEKLPRLVEVLAPRIVAIVRNPLASVNSSLRFYRKENEAIRTPPNVDRVLELTRTMEGSDLVQFTREQLLGMSDAAFEAVRWRVQSEPLKAFADQYNKGLAIRYENFADDPAGTAQAVFEFLGWEFDDKVRNFIATTNQRGEQANRNVDKNIYTIYRDPQQAMNRWKKDLEPAQVEDILRIVKTSPIMPIWPEISA
jgi:hypothetical protein